MRPAAFLSLYLFLFYSLHMAAIAANQSGPPEPKAMARITAAEAESRLTKKVDPAYPQMAKLAHIQGEVVLNIVISPQGKVVDVNPLSGHPILIQAAIDAVNEWEYRPYPDQENAQAVATIVHVKFSVSADPKAVPYPEDAYDDQERKCKGLMDEKAFDEAEAACALLPGLAEKVDTRDSIKDRENAYRYAGMAYYQVSKYQDAATEWQHQLAIARNNDFPSSDVGWVYYNVALALAGAGDLSGAGANWEKAKALLETAHQQSPDNVDISYKLERVLTAFAYHLRREGNVKKAQALEKEVESLEKEDESLNH